MIELKVTTHRRTEFIDITAEVQKAVERTGVRQGICVLFVPHTTAACTVNEHADPDVVRDILSKLGELVPEDDRYRHVEGNADSHIKATLCGASETLLIENGRIVLGTWQGIFFCEFDGPRSRKVWLQVIGA